MSRYIDADHLIERATNPYGDCWASTGESTSDFVDYINEEPTAEVKPIVYGKWKRNDVSLVYKCSVCKHARVSFPYPYCPMCGAEMINSAKW